MSQWGWNPERTLGIWRYGAPWLRPFVAAVPFLTVALLCLMMMLADGRLTIVGGTLFELPSGGDLVNVGRNCPVVMLMPREHQTMAFFDDARYVLGDVVSERQFTQQLSDRIERCDSRTILVLADRRVTCGVLMNMASFARHCGATKILFARKHVEDTD